MTDIIINGKRYVHKNLDQGMCLVPKFNEENIFPGRKLHWKAYPNIAYMVCKLENAWFISVERDRYLGDNTFSFQGKRQVTSLKELLSILNDSCFPTAYDGGFDLL